MHRADRNRWGAVVGLVLCAYAATLGLFVLADAVSESESAAVVVLCGGVLALSAVVVVGTRSLTNARRWWVVPLLCSPAIVVLVFTVLVNLSMRFGPVTPSYGDGIPGPWNEKYEAGLEVGSNDPGVFTQLQNKTIWIKVGDKQMAAPANDKIELRCCMPSGTVVWMPNGDAVITLYQQGIERTGADARYNDPYSVALARSGKRAMVRLMYAIDPKTGRFARSRFEVLDPAVMESQP